MMLKPPFVILGLVASTYSMSGPESTINVYKLELQANDTGNLLKTIPFFDSRVVHYALDPLKPTPEMNFSSNSHFIVLVQPSGDDNNIIHIRVFQENMFLMKKIGSASIWGLL